LHQHAHPGAGAGRILKWSFVATLAFVVLEFAAGLQAHSLALLSDAGHNLTDALALLLAWFAFYFQAKPADEIKTYGYHRAGILAAFVNALVLVALSVYIFYESYHRFLNPQPVNETTMLVVAGLGLVLNAAIMWGLRHEQKSDLNIRGAFLHMLGDALSSIGIIAGAIAIHYTGWQQIDPVLSVFIGLLIVWTAWDVIRESLNILLEGLPRGMSLGSVYSSIREVEGVIDVHDLHIWSLGSCTHALSCHVLVNDMPPSASDTVLRRLNTILSERFQIDHTTVQFEQVTCPLCASGCPIPGEAGRRNSVVS
jgi:cobalt-zinc-cadmium efflux system protein